MGPLNTPFTATSLKGQTLFTIRLYITPLFSPSYSRWAERHCSFICFGHTKHYLVLSHSLSKHHLQLCHHYAQIKLCLTLLPSILRYFPRPKSPLCLFITLTTATLCQDPSMTGIRIQFKKSEVLMLSCYPGSQTNSANKSNPTGRIKSKSKCKHKQEQITQEHHQTLDNKTVWQRREGEAGINIWGWRWGWLGAGETQEG